MFWIKFVFICTDVKLDVDLAILCIVCFISNKMHDNDVQFNPCNK